LPVALSLHIYLWWTKFSAIFETYPSALPRPPPSQFCTKTLFPCVFCCFGLIPGGFTVCSKGRSGLSLFCGEVIFRHFRKPSPCPLFAS